MRFRFSRLVLAVVLLALPAKVLQAQALSVRNTSHYLGDDRWEWTVFLNGDSKTLMGIAHVEYMLHPTFPNPLQKVTSIGDPAKAFALTATGWGVFEVGIRVMFRDGSVTTLKHMLTFAAARNACTQNIVVDERHYKAIEDAHFKNDIYVYVGEVKDKRKEVPSNVFLFRADRAKWGTSGKLKESEFLRRAATEGMTLRNERPDALWLLRTQKGGEALQ